ncbi:D-lactate dehydrogenase [Janthinobacterium sp. J1-1]|uniref:D-lactate dehydrogenase n=1 Tax=Janthinobacterium sp. J1-1 TaxID=3065910 RepID=UPI0028124D3A|nr:D-lactate dehydrogenase [Janthinobacterium sp. J1-1]
MSGAGNASLIAALQAIVGPGDVIDRADRMRPYCSGFRFGSGEAIAVVRPASLVQQWQVVQACVTANKIVIMQAANTGLTGGSTPDGNDYDRDIVIISTMRMKKLHVVDDGRQVVCFPGATLDLLERTLKPLGREPHSLIGSSCVGASVFGGVCNNSGGSLVQRGPAYTELSLYARVNEQGRLELVNHLGIALGDEPEAMLARLDSRDYTDGDIDFHGGKAHDDRYARQVREVDQDTPARYNADPQRLYECSGCAGKLILFAVRLDTFPAQLSSQVFYIGTNDPQQLTLLRRELLAGDAPLPIAAEYVHRDAFNLAERYGKDMFLLIRLLGTARLPALFAAKARLDRLLARWRWLPADLSDRAMQWMGRCFPSHLPPRMLQYRDLYQHHLMLKVAGDQAQATRDLLERRFQAGEGAFFTCDADEGARAFLHRFAVAGAAVRYRTMHRRHIADIVALDIALPRNTRDWFEQLPPQIDAKLSQKLYYGHFLCHVFHQDYIVNKGHDAMEVEHEMLALLDQRGAEYPAEHNVGHLYAAKPALAAFYREIDPCNQFNPGIGKTSKLANWGEGAGSRENVA